MSESTSEFKLNIHADPIDGYYMDDYDFEAQIYASANEVVSIPKNKMKKVDRENYVVAVDSEAVSKIGKGKLKLRLVAYIPDADFTDRLRTETAEIETEIIIA